ncbi:MAG: M61 family metallopeptidase [Pseudarcicella sp.]|nr:M61 family metallopeptidase [Pseudarcicella sp.]MBP6410066.1 M61 family metallopeptidase [Pseudarcicella sp.]
MKKKYSILSFICILLLNITNISNAQIKIDYSLEMPKPHTHYFEVGMHLKNIEQAILNKGYLDIKMAVWTPGSYLVRDFAKNVEGMVAKVDNRSEKIIKINKNTWRIKLKPQSKEVQVNYSVYAFELSVRTSFIDDSHGYLNPGSVFVYINQLKNTPANLTITPFKDWSTITTGLKETSKNVFEIPNLDILVDSPIEIGNQKEYSFDVNGTVHKIGYYGDSKFDSTRLFSDMKRLCKTAIDIYGEIPCKNYTFILIPTLNNYGGLEHLNSTTCIFPRNFFESEKTYKKILSLLAHEYFHLWNVKRLRPYALGPFNYEAENITSMLWFSEGFTSYYENYILRKSGLITSQDYLTNFVEDINIIENQSGTSIQSVSESSIDAWIKFYKPNENSKNSTVSYYTKGAILGGILNMEILKNTNGTKNLDDFMQTMYQTYFVNLKKGFTDSEFKTSLEKFIGKKMDDFYEKCIYGTSPIDYNAAFDVVGLELNNVNENSNSPYLGVSFTGNIVKFIAKDSPAYESGLNVNDEIISINDKTEDPTKCIATKKPGETIAIKLIRDGIQKNLKVELKRNTNKFYEFVIKPNRTSKQEELYNKWLNIN